MIVDVGKMSAQTGEHEDKAVSSSEHALGQGTILSKCIRRFANTGQNVFSMITNSSTSESKKSRNSRLQVAVLAYLDRRDLHA